METKNAFTVFLLFHGNNGQGIESRKVFLNSIDAHAWGKEEVRKNAAIRAGYQVIPVELIVPDKPEQEVIDETLEDHSLEDEPVDVLFQKEISQKCR